MASGRTDRDGAARDGRLLPNATHTTVADTSREGRRAWLLPCESESPGKFLKGGREDGAVKEGLQMREVVHVFDGLHQPLRNFPVFELQTPQNSPPCLPSRLPSLRASRLICSASVMAFVFMDGEWRDAMRLRKAFRSMPLK